MAEDTIFRVVHKDGRIFELGKHWPEPLSVTNQNETISAVVAGIEELIFDDESPNVIKVYGWPLSASSLTAEKLAPVAEIPWELCTSRESFSPMDLVRRELSKLSLIRLGVIADDTTPGEVDKRITAHTPDVDKLTEKMVAEMESVIARLQAEAADEGAPVG